MNNDARYVFDTNVIISALLFEKSVPAQAFFTAHSTGTILLSAPLVQEINDTLRRPKFERYVPWNEREEFISALVRDALIVKPSEPVSQGRDPRDNMLLEVAVAGAATLIVTGDADLLCMNPFQHIPILTPAEFLKR